MEVEKEFGLEGKDSEANRIGRLIRGKIYKGGYQQGKAYRPSPIQYIISHRSHSRVPQRMVQEADAKRHRNAAYQTPVPMPPLPVP